MSSSTLNQNHPDDMKILDGGFASELIRLGHRTDDDPLWSARWLIKDPSAIVAVHFGFLESGADVITTASYQASIHGFCEHANVNVEKAKELIRSSVTIAKKTRDTFWEKFITDQQNEASEISRVFPAVAGSVGPYGAFCHDGSEYTGEYAQSMSIEELMDWHRPRLACLSQAGADLIAFETIPAAKEGKALIKLLREFPNTKAWISFSCKDNSSVSDGDSFRAAVKMCVQEAPSQQLIAVGVNCVPPGIVSDLLLLARKEIGPLRLLTYPNSGEKWTLEKGWFWDGTPIPIHAYLPTWLEAGATWIGGCCRITPKDIAKIRKQVHLWRDTDRIRENDASN